jgi:TetR/AcrR family transcriptional regulator, ethionamide resistance regulator
MGVAARKKTQDDRERRRADIRRRLLRAAEILIADGEAYSTITIERLANQAGLSRATFYIYFGGKGDLLRAWFSETVEDLDQACAAWRQLGPRSSRADFTAALASIVEAYCRHAPLMTAINDEATQDSVLRDQLRDIVQHGIDALRAQIEEGQRDGWIDPALLPAETATWAIWLLERGLGHVVAPATGEQTATLTEALGDLAWHTLRSDR